MTPTSQGKHCSTCEKDVIDFTSLTKRELHSHITSDKSICGRFRQDQLNTSLYFEPTKARQWKKYAASLLFSAALFIINKSDAQTSSKTPHNRLPHTIQTTKKYDSLGIGSLSRKQDTTTQELHCVKGIVSGNYSVLSQVHIYVSGTQRSTVTKLDGEYEISIAKGDTLTFLHSGFKPKKVVYKDQKSISVNLDPIKIIEDGFTMGKIIIIEEDSKKQ